MIIGITGGSGSGKTTLLKLIAQAGGTVLDCDAIYHELLLTDTAMLQAIDQRFPGTVENGVLNRKKLGERVFTDEAALQDLNRITHGHVKAQVLQRLSPAPKLAAIDAIALFEGGLAELCDATVAVTAPREARVARLMQREGISAEYAQKRIDAQKSDGDFNNLCGHTLENSGSLEEFSAKCLAFFTDLAII